MGLDFCNETQRQNLLIELSKSRNLNLKGLYTYLCPVFMFVCFCSIVFNAVLLIISRRCKTINKTSILLLSLNLALTDLIASFLNGLSLLFNSYLPEVHNWPVFPCYMLLLEVFRCAALVASALHLLALAAVHYRGIVDPLHYRSTILYSQRLSRTINMISVGCWLIPLSVIFGRYTFSPCQASSNELLWNLHISKPINLGPCTWNVHLTASLTNTIMDFESAEKGVYFVSTTLTVQRNHDQILTCNGFQTAECDYLFLTSFSFRYTVFTLFAVPLLLMSLIYLRIYIFISRLQKSQRSNHQERLSLSREGAYDTRTCGSLNGVDAPEISTLIQDRKGTCLACSELEANSSTQETTDSLLVDQAEASENQSTMKMCEKEQILESEKQPRKETMSEAISETPRKNEQLNLTCTCDKNKKRKKVVPKLARANTVAVGTIDETGKQNVSHIFKGDKSSVVSTTTQISTKPTKNSLKFYLRRSKKTSNQTMIPGVSTTVCSTTGMPSNNHNNNNSSNYEPQRLHLHSTALPPRNAKALVTTLLILGTYFMSYLPAVAVQVLTCVDDCPYPLYTIPFWLRVLIGTMSTLLIIIKSILDPLIYTYRMKEIQEAVNKCISRRLGSKSVTEGSQYSTSLRLNNSNRSVQQQTAKLDNLTGTGGSMRVFSETCSSPTASTVRPLNSGPVIAVHNHQTTSSTDRKKRNMLENSECDGEPL